MPSNTEKLFKELAKLTNQTNIRYNKRLLKSYKVALAQIRDDITQLYAKFGNSTTFASAANRLANLEKNVASAIIDLTGDNIKTIRSATAATYDLNYKGTNKIFGEFGILNQRAVAASVVNPYRWEGALDRYNSQDLAKIRNITTSALITGEGLNSTLKKVTDVTNISSRNAMRILRTEIHRNENAAKLASIDANIDYAKELGIEFRKTWISVIDDRTRDSHITMNRQQANPISGFFTFPNGGTASAPGNSGIPEEDINCRCTVILDVPEDVEREYMTADETIRRKQAIDDVASGKRPRPVLGSPGQTAPIAEQTGLTRGQQAEADIAAGRKQRPVLGSPSAKAPTTEIPQSGVDRGLLSREFSAAELDAPFTKEQYKLMQGQMMRDHGVPVFADNGLTLRRMKYMNQGLDEAFTELKNTSKVFTNEYNKTITQISLKKSEYLHIGGQDASSRAIGSFNSSIGPKGFKEIEFASNYKFPVTDKLTLGGGTVDTSIKGVIRHEYGHYAYQTNMQISKFSHQPYGWLKNSAGETFEDVLKNSGISRAGIKTEISGYASTSLNETFAESFSAITHPQYFSYKKRLPLSIEKWLIDVFQIIKPI